MTRRRFYADLHIQAAAMIPAVPNPAGARWIDVGCGPGLMTRIAASFGYEATGIDTSQSMVATARRQAAREGSAAQFRRGGVADLPIGAARVVSALSLLAVLTDPVAGVRQLWDAVAPGGSLLVVEPSERMTPAAALSVIDSSYSLADSRGLVMWATARAGGWVDPTVLGVELGAAEHQPLLGGLVSAWRFAKGG
jgi:2-polyprenyl-3-methyl-5-hydroxy-6-metoxy-1,4-benzoquinol methylase